MSGADDTSGTAPRTVTLVAADSEVVISLIGATPLSWTLPLLGQVTDILDGYRDAEELAAQGGVRNGVMAPFCNRVADGRYTFDGVTHDLLPGAHDRTIYHGLVRTEPFVLVELEQREREATALFRCDALATGRATGYPYEVVVEVSYRLTTDTLEMAVTGRNVGDVAAPFAAGWHPYFRLPSRTVIDGLHLTLPATVAILADEALIPLPGDDAYEERAEVSWKPLGGSVIDAAFGALRPDDDGIIRTVLEDPESGVRLTVSQERGLVHVFTGDTLDRDRRASIAIEPVEVMTDAWGRPDCATAIRLEPATARRFSFATTVTAP
ncbi:aldose 1-epimerase [Cellulomonas sp. URHD0024]|uniref:aldose 1-epimerase n=1 Tax=Cellulomonas sp. URHD0024 TaxID=1302620 RepID=UPI0006889276|nr:aldose 1-epimerase [Cellulomonas sp. URHD0024]